MFSNAYTFKDAYSYTLLHILTFKYKCLLNFAAKEECEDKKVGNADNNLLHYLKIASKSSQ